MSLKNRLLNTYFFVQLLYAVRELWWGISAGYLNFGLHRLNEMVSEVNGFFLVLVGLLGIMGAIMKNNTCNIVYTLLNIFVFATTSLTFFITTPKSSGGVNYLIETAGAIWLAYRVKYSHENENKTIQTV
jgi:hypothetical protein